MAPYQYDAAVAATAAAHSADQAARRTMSHTGSDGSNAGQRLTRNGVTWQSWGENVGAGFNDPAVLLQAWLNSPTHRPIVLSASYTRVGVGVADGVQRHPLLDDGRHQLKSPRRRLGHRPQRPTLNTVTEP